MAMVKSFVFLSLAFVIGGCCSGPQTIHHDDLDKLCGSLPCDFSLVSGNASIVTTYHSGEHGIRLEKNSTVRFELDASTPAPLASDAELRVLFLCDDATSFDVVLGSADASGPSEVSLTGVPSAASDTGELPFATYSIPGPGSEVLTRPQFRSLQFTTIGPGGCTIDDVWVFLPNLCQG